MAARSADEARNVACGNFCGMRRKGTHDKKPADAAGGSVAARSADGARNVACGDFRGMRRKGTHDKKPADAAGF